MPTYSNHRVFRSGNLSRLFIHSTDRTDDGRVNALIWWNGMQAKSASCNLAASSRADAVISTGILGGHKGVQGEHNGHQCARTNHPSGPIHQSRFPTATRPQRTGLPANCTNGFILPSNTYRMCKVYQGNRVAPPAEHPELFPR